MSGIPAPEPTYRELGSRVAALGAPAHGPRELRFEGGLVATGNHA